MSSTLSAIREFSIKSLRDVLHFVYHDKQVYSIPFGPLRGMRMRYFESLQFHMILGLYDSRYSRILLKVLQALGKLGPGKVFCDIGANVGMYSLWFSRLIPQGTVYCFEPMPECFHRLEDNLALNDITNTKAVRLACSNADGTADMFAGNGSHEVSSFFEEWASNNGIAPSRIQVSTTSLDTYFSHLPSEQWPDFIKMDIEGGGVFALKAVDKVIAQKRPLFLIESHSPAEDRTISDLAVKHSYVGYRLNNEQWIERMDETHPFPDGVWGTLLLIPSESLGLAEKALKTKHPRIQAAA